MSICRRSSLSHHQPASQTAFVFLWGGQPPDLGEELAWFPLKTEGEGQWPCLLISLSRLKEKDSACACLFSPRLNVEDSDHALLCIVKMLNQQNHPHTPQHMSFLQEKVSLKVSTKHVQISKDLTKRPNRLYTFSMSFLISRVFVHTTVYRTISLDLTYVNDDDGRWQQHWYKS
jgi:hypothetical protein